MITCYNRIAGQSVERLAALSDGIFGVAMTLLSSASPGFTWRSGLPSLSCRFPPGFSGRTTPIAPPYSSTGATSSSLVPCFTPAGVTPPAPASSRTTGLPKCPLSAAVCRRTIIGQSWYAFGCCAVRLQHLPQRAHNHLRPVVLHALPVAPPASHRKPFHSPIRSVVTESLFL
jgi:hypothetical protein